MIRYLASFAAAALLVGLAWPASAQPVPAQPTTAGSAPQDIRLGLITRKPPPPPTYTFDPIPEDEGFAGAQVALRENNTTGAFTGRRFTLDEAALEEGESPVGAARKMVEGGAAFLAVSLPADETLAVADAVKDRALVFNVGCRRRPAARGRLPREPVPRRPEPGHARRRARPVPRLQALAQGVPHRRAATAPTSFTRRPCGGRRRSSG